jgi:protein-disulfide isomerase
MCIMASRTAQRRESAARLRLALAEAERRAVTRRQRRNAGVGVVLAAVLVVAVAIATSGGGRSTAHAGAASGAPVADAAYTSALLAGIPQHGIVLGDPRAPERMVEFADLQCPYCDEFSTQALPRLIARYVRPGKLSIEFRNLAFIGPDSVRAARAAAGAELQNRLWNFVELMYYNQGEENTGYVTGAYLHRLLAAIPGLDVAGAERDSQTPQAAAVLTAANAAASAGGIDATPSFLIGRASGPLHLFQPGGLTAGAFTGALDQLIGGRA